MKVRSTFCPIDLMGPVFVVDDSELEVEEKKKKKGSKKQVMLQPQSLRIMMINLLLGLLLSLQRNQVTSLQPQSQRILTTIIYLAGDVLKIVFKGQVRSKENICIDVVE